MRQLKNRTKYSYSGSGGDLDQLPLCEGRVILCRRLTLAQSNPIKSVEGLRAFADGWFKESSIEYGRSISE